MKETMDSEEFKRLVMPHYRTMYGVAAALLGDCDLSSDAVQDAMVRLWEIRSGLRDVRNIRGFVMKVTRNICLDSMRRDRHMADISDPVVEQEAGTPGEDDPMAATDTLRHVERMMSSLPDAQRKVLMLRAYADLDNDEIAEQLGISGDTVRQQLSRARRKLREMCRR
ncbi:MAG: sigma-70 family RNA polymerase sigma factor [Muribaculaceae bacterium]|nr:sigma-70 family RNA polymerase sigma factor [Muribaculaceae bacterium]